MDTVAVCTTFNGSYAWLMNVITVENKELCHHMVSACIEVDCCAMGKSFGKLLFKLNGLPVNLKVVELALAVTYNYICCVYKTSSSCHVLYLKSHDCSVDEIISLVVDKVLLLKKELLGSCLSVSTTDVCCSKRLFNELLSGWLPACMTVTVIHILVFRILCYINDKDFINAVDLSSALTHGLKSVNFSECQDKDADLFIPLSLMFDCSENCILVSFVHLISAIAYFHVSDWQTSLSCLEFVNSSQFCSYVSYFKGKLLMKLQDYTSAADVLSEVYQDSDANLRIQLHALSLLGDCYSCQGKFQSAIIMYKRCLLHDMSFIYPLYSIALQYHSLGLLNAELRILQLLWKTMLEQLSLPDCSSKRFLPLSTEQLVEYTFVHEAVVDKVHVMYLLASRSRQLGKYSLAADMFRNCLLLINEATTVSLPDVEAIYEEAILCHLEAGIYRETVDLCDSLLEKLNCQVKENLLPHKLPIKECSCIHLQSLCDSCKLFAIKVMMYKAKAVEQLGRFDDALHCINCAAADAQWYLKDQNMKSLSVERKKFIEEFMSEIYVMKCRLLTALNRIFEAVHNDQLSKVIFNAS